MSLSDEFRALHIRPKSGGSQRVHDRLKDSPTYQRILRQKAQEGDTKAIAHLEDIEGVPAGGREIIAALRDLGRKLDALREAVLAPVKLETDWMGDPIGAFKTSDADVSVEIKKRDRERFP
jgi:hypothetical protein